MGHLKLVHTLRLVCFDVNCFTMKNIFHHSMYNDFAETVFVPFVFRCLVDNRKIFLSTKVYAYIYIIYVCA